MQETIYQPIEETFVPTAAKKQAINLTKFIKLLTEEENYYPGEQHNTKLMITRLRKVFYDQWGWSTEVIRGAAKIKGRYKVTMVKAGEKQSHYKSWQKNRRNKNYDFEGLVPVVVYKKDDKVYPEKAGQVPEIYANDNQEVILPSGWYCDIGHILTGVDAFNYPAPVTPLPKFVSWLYPIFPHVNSNVDFATWLGDVASVAGNYLFYQLQQKKLDNPEQKAIDEYAPGSDMLGNIDAYVIAGIYNIKATVGARFTQILSDYYTDEGIGKYYREHRCSFFCNTMGLKNWDGEKFENEKQWLKYQVKQLRIATAFYIYGDLKNLTGLGLALKTWMRLLDKQLDLKRLMEIFLQSLKAEIKEEPAVIKS